MRPIVSLIHMPTFFVFIKYKGAAIIDEKWKYQSTIILKCSHFGEHKNRGKGMREVTEAYACGCKFEIRISFNNKFEKYVVYYSHLFHQNHPISESLILTYRVKE
jgi:hypothetical protein